MSKPPPRLLLRSLPRQASNHVHTTSTPSSIQGGGGVISSPHFNPSQQPLNGGQLACSVSSASTNRVSGIHTSSRSSSTNPGPSNASSSSSKTYWPLLSSGGSNTHTNTATTSTSNGYSAIHWPVYTASAAASSSLNPTVEFGRATLGIPSSRLVPDYPLATSYEFTPFLSSSSSCAAVEVEEIAFPFEPWSTSLRQGRSHLSSKSRKLELGRGGRDGRREKSRSPSRQTDRDILADSASLRTPAVVAVAPDVTSDSLFQAPSSSTSVEPIHIFLGHHAYASANPIHSRDDDASSASSLPPIAWERDSSTRHGLCFHPGAYGIPKKRHQDPVEHVDVSSVNGVSPRSSDSQTHFKQILQDETDTATTTSTADTQINGDSLHVPASGAIQVGEDAYFFRSEALGIADGVGGWTAARARSYAKTTREDGEDEESITARARKPKADPGLFSRLLMHYCDREVEAWRGGKEDWLQVPTTNGSGKVDGESADGSSANGSGLSMSFGTESLDAQGREKQVDSLPALANGRVRRALDPVEVMQKAYERCMDAIRAEGIFGSATCLLTVLTQDELHVANMGDCAMAVVRKGEIVFRTEEMQHSFNFPIQLGTNSRDEPMKDAQLVKFKVEKADIVIMCTDGLVDNLFDEDILEVIDSFAPPGSLDHSGTNSTGSLSSTNLPPFSPQAVSEALCRAAQVASEETAGASPFMCRAIEEGIDFLGGKKDDISVLVAVIQAEL